MDLDVYILSPLPCTYDLLLEKKNPKYFKDFMGISFANSH